MLKRFAPGFFFLAVLLTFTGSTRAEELQLPESASPFMDEVGLVSSSQARQEVLSTLQQLNASGTVQMVVYIPQSLSGYEIEEFSIRLAEKWKIGKKGKDQGLILVIAPNERKMRLEVGYGLEGDIPDARARRIISERIAPFFAKGDYASGILSGIHAVASLLQAPLGTEAPALPERRHSASVPLKSYILFLIVFFWILASIIGTRVRGRGGYLYHNRRSSGWGGGGWSGGGSFGGGGGWSGGGGGGFGGGGASGSW